MKKAIFVSVGIAALLGAGCMVTSPTTTPPSNEDRRVPPQEPTDPVFDSSMTSSTEGNLSIHVKIPVMTAGLTAEARNTFNQKLSSDSRFRVSTFQSDFRLPESQDPRGAGAPPWTLDADYEIPTSTGRIQSIHINGYQYTGGAHGLVFDASYLFDTKAGAFLTLADLFETGTDYLGQLATSSRKILFTREYVKDDADWVNEGTAPTPDNYSIVYAVPEGLVVIFSDYQVAAHAAGPQTVVIPWSQLTGVKREYLP